MGFFSPIFFSRRLWRGSFLCTYVKRIRFCVYMLLLCFCFATKITLVRSARSVHGAASCSGRYGRLRFARTIAYNNKHGTRDGTAAMQQVVVAAGKPRTSACRQNRRKLFLRCYYHRFRLPASRWYNIMSSFSYTTTGYEALIVVTTIWYYFMRETENLIPRLKHGSGKLIMSGTICPPKYCA